MDFLTIGRRMSGGALALTLFALPLAGAAQDVPSYAQPVSVSTDETIHGRIASVDGAFNISVDDDRGFIDSVVLHQGTIINPTGLSLSPGMSVSILGYNAGSAFAANEIDTPYSYAGALPTPVYYGPGYWCPGFAYGYGPSFSLAIIIGGGYGRFEHRPFYGRPWDGHRYFGDYVGRADNGRGGDGYGRGSNARIDGGPRHLLEGGSARRSFVGETRSATHIPTAFAGRSFAGRTYSGETGAARTRTYAPGERSMTAPAARFGGANRPATGVTGGGQFRTGGYGGSESAPRTGGGVRSAGGFGGGGVARGRTGGGFSGGGARSAGGFSGGGMARGGAMTSSGAMTRGGGAMTRGGGAIRH